MSTNDVTPRARESPIAFLRNGREHFCSISFTIERAFASNGNSESIQPLIY